MLHNRVDRMPSLHHLALGLLALAATPVSAGVDFDICADFNTADMNAGMSFALAELFDVTPFPADLMFQQL
jgi:hypothetical protein